MIWLPTSTAVRPGAGANHHAAVVVRAAGSVIAIGALLGGLYLFFKKLVLIADAVKS